jgi:ubiquitin-conjugating enzyme E2 W
MGFDQQELTGFHCLCLALYCCRYSYLEVCLNVLYDGWSPALTVTSVCLSLVSMLSSAKEKGVPSDNDAYVRNCHGRSPKNTRWLFHDDQV